MKRSTHFLMTLAVAPDVTVEGTRIAPRPRNSKMDALMKHIHSSPKYSFEGACKAIGGAVKKAKRT